MWLARISGFIQSLRSALASGNAMSNEEPQAQQQEHVEEQVVAVNQIQLDIP